MIGVSVGGCAQAWTTGPIQAELAMMVLARLIEDCHDVDFRSEVRSLSQEIVCLCRASGRCPGWF